MSRSQCWQARPWLLFILYYFTLYTSIPHLIFTPFTIYSHLLFTAIYYLPPFTIYPHLLFPPFTIYPHLLFTPIYYLPPFTIYPHLLLYPLNYFSGIKTHRKSFRRFIFSSKHSHLMSKMTGIKNSYVEILKKFALNTRHASTVIRNSVKTQNRHIQVP